MPRTRNTRREESRKTAPRREPRTQEARPAGHSREEFAAAASLFRALSHPLRVRLVCGLLNEPQSQTAISRLLGVSQSLISQHLSVLRRAGVVRGTRKDGEVVLAVTDARLPAIFAAVCAQPDRLLHVRWEELRESPSRQDER